MTERTCCGLPLDSEGRCQHRPRHEQPKWVDLFGIDPNYDEGRPEEPTYTAAEVKVLTEAALRLGREETRVELEALRAIWWFIQDDFGVCDNGHGASITWAEANQLDELHDAVEVLYQEHGYPPKPSPEPQEAISNGLTATSGHSDLPPIPEARKKPTCPSCGSERWVSVSLNEGLTRLAQCVPCGAYHKEVIGPGWRSPRFHDPEAEHPDYRDLPEGRDQ